MKQAGCLLILASVLMFLLISHSASARILQDDNNQGSFTSSMATAEEDDNIAALMGSEECSGNDPDCVNRRMMADAHLDYIYTQRHKPTKAKGSP
ncbi:OLC1v1034312C2 [Oldenlandia corymbosa var. corymbosa]|uniref:Phytosulfokine n=1 Tax=Oldenlandia corymbosa var. corymbosa TaxID=529605 RepID=A0AAV1CQH1_OLDCO|nr:OLC1v1034312C2 [Oldenlandia corymbosa var. corymbosa]